MPATSEKQRKAACMALAAKKGKIKKGKLHKSSKQMSKMSANKLKHFCHSVK